MTHVHSGPKLGIVMGYAQFLIEVGFLVNSIEMARIIGHQKSFKKFHRHL